jgi:hypothetical protein
MSAIVEDNTANDFKHCRGIDEINEYIYKLILKNKHLEFVEMLDPNIASFSHLKDNKYFVPDTSVTFAYEDMVKGYSISYKAYPDLNILGNTKTTFSFDNEFSISNLNADISLIGGLSQLHDKALKEINRFRSDFLMTLESSDVQITETSNITYNFTFDFNNNIIDSSIAFTFNYIGIGINGLFVNFKLLKDDAISCGIALKSNYQTFLVGSTSKHMMLKFFLNDIGIENELETRNHTKEEVSNYMLLIDMKRI